MFRGLDLCGLGKGAELVLQKGASGEEAANSDAPQVGVGTGEHQAVPRSCPGIQLTREPPECAYREFIGVEIEERRQRIDLRARLIKFLFWVYAPLLASTVAIFYLQGFGVAKFHLDPEILKLLGYTALVGVGGLAGIAFRGLFYGAKN